THAPERRARDRRRRSDDRPGDLRGRRDHGRRPRPKPDDGELASRLRGLRPPGRARGRRRGATSATIETALRRAVEDAAADLYVWSLKDIPSDLRDALGAALERETHHGGPRTLAT